MRILDQKIIGNPQLWIIKRQGFQFFFGQTCGIFLVHQQWLQRSISG